MSFTSRLYIFIISHRCYVYNMADVVVPVESIINIAKNGITKHIFCIEVFQLCYCHYHETLQKSKMCFQRFTKIILMSYGIPIPRFPSMTKHWNIPFWTQPSWLAYSISTMFWKRKYVPSWGKTRLFVNLELAWMKLRELA
jgi:hypothetical protein